MRDTELGFYKLHASCTMTLVKSKHLVTACIPLTVSYCPWLEMISKTFSIYDTPFLFGMIEPGCLVHSFDDYERLIFVIFHLTLRADSCSWRMKVSKIDSIKWITWFKPFYHQYLGDLGELELWNITYCSSLVPSAQYSRGSFLRVNCKMVWIKFGNGTGFAIP